MTYSKTLEYIYKQLPCFQRIGKSAYKEDLHNTIALLDAIGNPHTKIRCIHIAGTNGKGSVSHMCASILQEAGYKTGLYTSPHLLDFRERVKINGVMMSKKYVVSFITKHQNIIERIKPSFFEITVAMAFDFFYKKSVDIAVIETGLGGRLDSTNVIEPLISIITNIGLDHMTFLGDTLEKIAIEKAGIIKPSVPVVIGETHVDTKTIFTTIAKEKNAPITFADSSYHITIADETEWAHNFSIKSQIGNCITHLQSPLEGFYQQKNILCCFAAITELKKKSLIISNNHIKKGIRNTILHTNLMGRWQIIQHKPFIVCDTAHNYDGIAIAMKQLCAMPSSQIHIVWGMVNDKDVQNIIPLLPSQAKYYLTQPSIERALPVNTLASYFSFAEHSIHSNVISAYKSAVKKLNPHDVLYIGGSTFVVADFLLKKNTKKFA